MAEIGYLKPFWIPPEHSFQVACCTVRLPKSLICGITGIARAHRRTNPL
ncbi:hypothetical protein EIKCOROL_00267 [Eikenella corrodens ATCC 23834]|uniref:Uncharacterized protein n=1 Tax=Eikenella corrodens ATCC 23834 TaxID=546274 RepID=C0DSE5_EIKCO|nr:hypothetical protein EIKCOROL_00267 [Eikenella corrodens ATCC 23834]